MDVVPDEGGKEGGGGGFACVRPAGNARPLEYGTVGARQAEVRGVGCSPSCQNGQTVSPKTSRHNR